VAHLLQRVVQVQQHVADRVTSHRADAAGEQQPAGRHLAILFEFRLQPLQAEIWRFSIYSAKNDHRIERSF
jgi:hypothetical protein